MRYRGNAACEALREEEVGQLTSHWPEGARGCDARLTCQPHVRARRRWNCARVSVAGIPSAHLTTTDGNGRGRRQTY